MDYPAIAAELAAISHRLSAIEQELIADQPIGDDSPAATAALVKRAAAGTALRISASSVYSAALACDIDTAAEAKGALLSNELAALDTQGDAS